MHWQSNFDIGEGRDWPCITRLYFVPRYFGVSPEIEEKRVG